MRKRPSKRRWIARFHLGKLIPRKAIEEHYDLYRLVKSLKYDEYISHPNRDAIQKKNIR